MASALSVAERSALMADIQPIGSTLLLAKITRQLAFYQIQLAGIKDGLGVTNQTALFIGRSTAIKRETCSRRTTTQLGHCLLPLTTSSYASTKKVQTSLQMSALFVTRFAVSMMRARLPSMGQTTTQELYAISEVICLIQATLPSGKQLVKKPQPKPLLKPPAAAAEAEAAESS